MSSEPQSSSYGRKYMKSKEKKKKFLDDLKLISFNKTFHKKKRKPQKNPALGLTKNIFINIYEIYI